MTECGTEQHFNMNNEHYFSANDYYKAAYGRKVYRLALDGGMTCPNRDGRIGFGGCSFCSERGSGDFTPAREPCKDFFPENDGSAENKNVLNTYKSEENFKNGGEGCSFKIREILPIEEQLQRAKELVSDKAGGPYIAYFQSFTNTYASPDYLCKLFSSVLCRKEIIALSVATRPDCISPEIIELLKKLRSNYKKDIYIELGLQTVNDTVARAFNRGYDYSAFLDAWKLLKLNGFPVIIHMILGLPTETPDDIYRSIAEISSLEPHGVKLSLLHILRGTAMEQEYIRHPDRFHLMNEQAYIETLCRCIELIPRETVIYRITGDAPKKLLAAPAFTADKKRVLNTINAYMKKNNIRQGRLINP